MTLATCADFPMPFRMRSSDGIGANLEPRITETSDTSTARLGGNSNDSLDQMWPLGY